MWYKIKSKALDIKVRNQEKQRRKTTARKKKKNKINEKFTSEEVKITEQSEKSLINRFRALKEIKKHEIH